MNNIDYLFQNKQKNILSVYFTAGFPKLNDTRKIILELQKAGIDMIEIGIPFSDPMADGKIIQNSSNIALRNGMNMKTLFSQLENIRNEAPHVPLIMMGYLNPIMQYGFEKFCNDCQTVDIDGMIIPDLPLKDYLNEYKAIADNYGLKIIMLITPETSDERIHLVDAYTNGFIYMVSSASTTGIQQDFNEYKQNYFRRINQMNLKNPRLVGFGISNKETFEAANTNASGAIVGSKFIQLLDENEKISEAVNSLLTLFKMSYQFKSL